MWFMMQGLGEVARELEARGIPFCLAAAPPWEVFPAMPNLAELVTDGACLRHLRQWRQKVGTALADAGVPLYQIETETLIPPSAVSDKQEYAAATIRRKITKQWMGYLEGARNPRDFYMGDPADYVQRTRANAIGSLPALPSHVPSLSSRELQDIKNASDFLSILQQRGLTRPNTDVHEVKDFVGGSSKGIERLQDFFDQRFALYGSSRNDPAAPTQSEISPYLHFGQISVLRSCWSAVAEAAQLRQRPKLSPDAVPQESLDAFLEELVVRRELAKNFVLHNPNYDNYLGIPSWAAQTLAEHESDPRPVVYTPEQLEQAKTHDQYWNACQNELLVTGKMHGYMRMYWGKKILEWCLSPQRAHELVVQLNDKYSLDGRDENGYTGISWCFGTHDRGWTERPIFGKVRYMNEKGLERKFDIQRYAQRWNSI